MWPWEHAAFGYLIYSGTVHLWRRASPTGQAAVTVLVATQLPDLIDKPLSWVFGLFPSGFAIAHSILVAVPALGLVMVLAAARGQSRLGFAFGIGYGSHLVGDVVYPLSRGEPPDVSRVLWPLVDQTGYEDDLGLVGRALAYFTEFLEAGATDPTRFALLLALPSLAVVVWLVDGAPGVGTVARALRPGGGRR